MVVESLESVLLNVWRTTPTHLMVEAVFLIFIVLLIFRKPKLLVDPNQELTPAEEDEIIAEWKPKPLVPDALPSDMDASLLDTSVVTSAPTDVIEIDGKVSLNFAVPNYLGLNMNERIIDDAVGAINKYAVGACGPRQFYGTMDAHLELESVTAKWFGTEDSVNYCYPFATTTSVVQAFVKNSDIVFLDEEIWYAARLGAQLSRGKVVTFKHNDMVALREAVAKAKATFQNWEKCNRWVVTEGIFTNSGTILDLPALIQLRKDFCLRLIIDESNSFGVLGKTGKGVCEHFDVPRDLVEISIGSLGTSFASLGGFTIGTKEICAHQRLASYAYIFSASPPCFNVVAATTAIHIIEEEGENMIQKLRNNTKLMHSELQGLKDFKVISDELSPLIHIRSTKDLPITEADVLLEKIVKSCLNDSSVAIEKAKYNRQRDVTAPPPTLKVHVSAAHTEEQIRTAANAIKRAIAENAK